MSEKTISRTDAQLLTLLAAGLGFKAVDDTLFAGEVDWAAIHRQAVRQTVIGVVYDGLTALPKPLLPPRELLLRWYAEVVRVEQMNARLNAALQDVVGRYRAAGLSPVLLKGQGVAQYYPHPLHRQPGDIDLYFAQGYERANEVAKGWPGVVFHPDTSYHRAMTWQGVEIENHLKYVDFYNGRNRRRWAAWTQLQPLTDGREHLKIGNFAVDVPSPQMNAVYIFLHLQHHFLQVGVGLRQVCDWLCLLHARQPLIDRAAIGEALRLLPIGRTMPALGRLAVEHLGFPAGELPFAIDGRHTAHDARLLLHDILTMGNFGHDTTLWQAFSRGDWLNNLKSYALALSRHVRICPLCPSEVTAYPLDWLRRRFFSK